MKKKSKFVTFILSFLPGLSHLYVGYKERAIIFFVLFFGAISSVAGLSVISNDSEYFVMLLFIYPLLWFISLVDAVSLTDRPLSAPGENGEEGLFNGRKDPDDPSWFNLSNKKLITVALSMVPGAGHMYLGLQNRGLALMTLFFFSAFLMGWLRMSVFVFVLPVIWFYSLFDAYHRVENSQWPHENEWESAEQELPFFSWVNQHPHWSGWALIILGCFVLFERVISPLLTWQVRNYLQTGIVALILIGGGIKLLLGSRQNDLEIAKDREGSNSSTISKNSAGIESSENSNSSENGDLKEE
ncbi:MAG: hypothetical protein ACOX2X_00030 [Peptococcia bacterium]